tara:strand:+ start:242 stop:535 length:294 start_codon:yes stop_codon:yes gene_type:complete
MVDVEKFLMSLRGHKDADGRLNPIYLADNLEEEIKIISEAVADSKRWIGLTDKEIDGLTKQRGGEIPVPYGQLQVCRIYALAVESKLWEKNLWETNP